MRGRGNSDSLVLGSRLVQLQGNLLIRKNKGQETEVEEKTYHLAVQ